jgi:uncharacterized membrane protein YfcA
MAFDALIPEIGLLGLLFLLLLSLVAGFIDAVVGGGGLISLPALLIQLPTQPLPLVFGTNKIAALAGTSVAAVQYAKKIRFKFKLLLITALTAILAAFLGAKALHFLNPYWYKPLILLILIGMAWFTWKKKDFGQQQRLLTENVGFYMKAVLLGGLVGFYDGIFGPGAGSFLVMGFVVWLGFDFLHASAYAKWVNVATNLSALGVFIGQGQYWLELGILMALANVTGNSIGSRMAIKKGNGFIRIVFLLVVSLLIIRLAYSMWTMH